MYDPSKVERVYIKEWGHHAIHVQDFEACAAALAEAIRQRDEALRVVKDYREGHVCYKVDHNGIKRDFRCSICKAADEALGGK